MWIYPCAFCSRTIFRRYLWAKKNTNIILNILIELENTAFCLRITIERVALSSDKNKNNKRRNITSFIAADCRESDAPNLASRLCSYVFILPRLSFCKKKKFYNHAIRVCCVLHCACKNCRHFLIRDARND